MENITGLLLYGFVFFKNTKKFFMNIYMALIVHSTFDTSTISHKNSLHTGYIVGIDMKKWLPNFSHFKTHLKIEKSQLKCSSITVSKH